jgi:hypothetical protein
VGGIILLILFLARMIARVNGRNPLPRWHLMRPGSANPEEALVDGVVKKSVDKAAMSTAAAIDSSMAYSKTDISITGIKSKKTRYFITNVKGFEPSDDGQAQTFMQSSIGNANSRAVINLGLGRRYLSGDETVLTGFNAFLDYDPKIWSPAGKHWRGVESLGLRIDCE